MDRKLAHERKIAKLESRRATKPIVEKRRRARINQYLVELKRLICQATNRDLSRSSKLEKADILEMTVAFLQNMQQRQLLTGISADPRGMGKFTGGFVECAGEVQRYLQATDCIEPNLRQRLVEHMQQCAVSLGTTTIAAAAAAAAGSSCNNSLAVVTTSDGGEHGPPSTSLMNLTPQQQLLLLPPSNSFSNHQFVVGPHHLNPTNLQQNDESSVIPPQVAFNLQQQQELLNSVLNLPAGAQFTDSNASLPTMPQHHHLLAASSFLSPTGVFNMQRYYASLHNGNNNGGAAAGNNGGERDNANLTPNFSSHSPSSSSTSSSLRSSSEASSHTSETEMIMMRPTSSCRSSSPPRLEFVQPLHRPQDGSLQNNMAHRPPTSSSSNSNGSSNVWRPW